jgi:hypothetical protein
MKHQFFLYIIVLGQYTLNDIRVFIAYSHHLSANAMNKNGTNSQSTIVPEFLVYVDFVVD